MPIKVYECADRAIVVRRSEAQVQNCSGALAKVAGGHVANAIPTFARPAASKVGRVSRYKYSHKEFSMSRKAYSQIGDIM
jgi:hypothetical protein